VGIVSGRIVGASKIVGIVVGAVLAVGAGWADCQVAAFNASMGKVYDVPLPAIERSSDPAVIARGKHLAESVGACATRDCHGADLGGGAVIAMGPLGTFAGPNITMGNLGLAYSDGELARVVQHGLKKDGRSLRFMPAGDVCWLPDSDVAAIVSYLRAAPPVERASQPSNVGLVGKLLDRSDKFPMDIARRIDHGKREIAPAPEPTPRYGAFIARLCSGCHGEHLSGGPIPGAPPSIPTPVNITPDASGLQGWTFDDFDTLMRTGARKSGKPLNAFMPIEAWRNFDDTEMHALWAYLQSVPPRSFGGR
jgi:hypothetical protein